MCPAGLLGTDPGNEYAVKDRAAAHPVASHGQLLSVARTGVGRVDVSAATTTTLATKSQAATGTQLHHHCPGTLVAQSRRRRGSPCVRHLTPVVQSKHAERAIIRE